MPGGMTISALPRSVVKMRSLLTDTRELAKKLASLETESKSR